MEQVKDFYFSEDGDSNGKMPSIEDIVQALGIAEYMDTQKFEDRVRNEANPFFYRMWGLSVLKKPDAGALTRMKEWKDELTRNAENEWGRTKGELLNSFNIALNVLYQCLATSKYEYEFEPNFRQSLWRDFTVEIKAKCADGVVDVFEMHELINEARRRHLWLDDAGKQEIIERIKAEVKQSGAQLETWQDTFVRNVSRKDASARVDTTDNRAKLLAEYKKCLSASDLKQTMEDDESRLMSEMDALLGKFNLSLAAGTEIYKKEYFYKTVVEKHLDLKKPLSAQEYYELKLAAINQYNMSEAEWEKFAAENGVAMSADSQPAPAVKPAQTAESLAAVQPEETQTCAICGAALPKGAKFCLQCGAKVEQPITNCPQCGADLPKGAKFCMQCGTKIGEAASTAIQAAATELPKTEKTAAKAEASVKAEQRQVASATRTDSPRSSATNDDMVLIQGGTFKMGNDGSYSNDDKPAHDVTLSSYYISKYQVTQNDWQKVMGYNPSFFTKKGFISDEDIGLRPVESVSWYDAIKYCNRRSVEEGLTPCYAIDGENVTCDWNADGYRLPTEAEWEYAERGGGKASWQTKYSGSDKIKEVAWYDKNAGGKTHQVGLKKPNAAGLYDMSGNVEEWCWDWYGYYPSGAVSDPVGASSGEHRVLRGGSWLSRADYCRVSYRCSNSPDDGDFNLGFRVCCRA